MDQRISFGTKEQSNERRERAFLALSPSERFQWFLRSFGMLPSGQQSEDKGNFIIRKRNDGSGPDDPSEHPIGE